VNHPPVVPPHAIRYFNRWEHCIDTQPGDLILVATDDLFAKIIRFGERLRMHGDDKVFTRVNHAMIALGDGTGTVVEMIGGGGTVTPLAHYQHLSYAVINTTATDAQHALAVKVARWYTGVDYGFPSVASDALYLLTGIPLALTIGQSVVCSAMATATQRPLGLIPSKADIAVLPSDLAQWYDVRLP
jgi:hypothetical protein